MLHSHANSLKHLISLVFGLLTLILFSECHPDNSNDPAPQETFPQIYTYDTLVLGPTKYFVLTNISQNEIAPSGTFFGFDLTLKDELTAPDIASSPIRKMELLSENSLHLYIYQDGISSDATIPYQKDADGSILIDAGDGTIFTFKRDIANHILTSPLVSTFYSHQAGSAIHYGPLDISPSTKNYLNTVQALRNQFNLIANDTIAVNISGYRFK